MVEANVFGSITTLLCFACDLAYIYVRHSRLHTGRIQIKVLTTLPFFFLGFLVSKDNI